MGKCLEISQKLHGGDRRHITVRKKKKKKKKKKKISKSTDESFFTLCEIQFPISQNRSVQLVPCFVGVHHIFQPTCLGETFVGRFLRVLFGVLFFFGVLVLLLLAAIF